MLFVFSWSECSCWADVHSLMTRIGLSAVINEANYSYFLCLISLKKVTIQTISQHGRSTKVNLWWSDRKLVNKEMGGAYTSARNLLGHCVVLFWGELYWEASWETCVSRFRALLRSTMRDQCEPVSSFIEKHHERPVWAGFELYWEAPWVTCVSQFRVLLRSTMRDLCEPVLSFIEKHYKRPVWAGFELY